MKLHNTLTKQAEAVEPLESDVVRIYSCGPTVYNHIHIGNLSSFIFADTLRRALNAVNLKTKHVMNFTDVDDKTINCSLEKYADLEPTAALSKLTQEYSDIFIEDMQAVGNDTSAIEFVKATESIDKMQALIKELLDKDFAYIADDGIYFSIEAYKKDGKTYGQLTSVTVSSTSEARIQNDEYDKESAHDFALWKKQKPGEPAWNFEINGQNLKGRPGWHIECSAMSSGLLGQPFDIHTGGVDLIFPHHENEIAQSTAGKDNLVYAAKFAHNEHLLVDGQKMSKSLNNFYTLEDIRKKGFDPLAFRLLVLQSHYRSQAHFTWTNLEAAQNRLKGLFAMSSLQHQAVENAGEQPNYERVTSELVEAISDDLDTPKALAVLSNIKNLLEVNLVGKDQLQPFKALLGVVGELLGIDLSVDDISDEQKGLIQERETARQSKDWARSDEIRDKLVSQGIGLRDTQHGAIWFPL